MNCEAREDAVQEVIANAYVAFARLVQRDKASVAFPGVLARASARLLRDAELEAARERGDAEVEAAHRRQDADAAAPRRSAPRLCVPRSRSPRRTPSESTPAR